MTELDDKLSEQWGPLARFSEYRRGDRVSYRIGKDVFEGLVIWIVAPGEETTKGQTLPMIYVIEREGWDAIPDCISQSEILGLSGAQEPVLVQCLIHPSAWYYEGGQCPLCWQL